MKLAAACVLVLAAAAAQPTTFYVSPAGSDSNAGTSPAAAFATLGRARDAVRAVAGPVQAGEIFVRIAEGAYYLSDALELGLADGGSNGFGVTWLGAGPGPSVIHKGVAVTGWAVHDAAKNIWAAALPAGVADARQVYIGGERMNVTNSGAGLPAGMAVTDAGYTTPAPLPWLVAPEQAAQDIEFLFTGDGSSWTECRLRVAAIAPAGAGSAVTMQQPGWTLGRNRFYGQAIKTPQSVANLYVLLSAATPGAYYLNSATRTLYYVPRPQDDMASAAVLVPSGDEVLLAVAGDRAAQPDIRRVTGLTLQGLTFSYAGWLGPNSGAGWVDMQSGFQITPSSTADDTTWVPLPGAVQLHTVGAARITGCTFAHLGAAALVIDGGSQDVLVQNNTFVDVSGGGVYFGAVNDANLTDATRDDAHVVVDGNLFAGIPVEYRDCAAVLGGFLLNASITHNSILDCPNTGISLGWGWARDAATNAAGNCIVGNYVFGSNWLLEDGGSIYVLGPQPASLMAENYVSSQRKLFGALYTDEGSAFWHITRNVVRNVPEWLHIWTPSIHDELVDFCFTDSNYSINHGTRCPVRNITVVAPGAAFPAEAQAIVAAAGTPAMAGPKP